MKAPAIAAALLLVASSSTLAQTDCSNAQTQMAMNICADQSYKAADAALNAAYKTLSGSVSPAGKKQLQITQRAWIAWRDAQCAFETMASADGSIYPMLVSACLEELTIAQTARLSAQANCQEGDLSCGGQ